MTKKAVLGVAFLLLCSASAVASSVDFATNDGTLKASNSGLSLSTSMIDFISAAGKVFTGDLGTVSFSTGTLAQGSLQTGAVFNAGGSFTIIANGADGIHSGVLFNGTFSGPVVWSVINLGNGTHAYTMTGTVSGTWFTGATVDGAVTELTIIGNIHDGQIKLSSGDLNLNGPGIGVRSVVPEPSSIMYLGTGLIGLAGMIRRKFLS